MKKLEHIGRLARISVSGYRGRRFEPRQQYVVSLIIIMVIFKCYFSGELIALT